MSDSKKSKPKSAKKQTESGLDSLELEAEFLDREVAEDALHSQAEKTAFGISREEPELELGGRIEYTRRELRLTQGELAERTKLADREGVGISRAVISMYEVGKNRPSPREVRILCEVLRVTPNYLIYGHEDPFDGLSEYERFEGFYAASPETYALLLYYLNQLHHNHRQAIMQLILGLQRGWNKNFNEDQSETANQFLLNSAEALKRALANKR